MENPSMSQASRQEKFSGTMAVRAAHHIDKGALDLWMRAHVEGYEGPLEIAEFKGGQSNPTYKLTTPGAAYVLRRKPPGKLLQSAHAVDREYKVVTALAATGFPVARTHGLCTDEGVIGTWFYVMDFVEGRIFWDASFPQLPREARAAYFDAMNAALARLHCADHAALGLADFGKAGNYFARQIARWSRQYEADEAAGRFPAMDRLVAWLPAHIPPGDETAIVHGDYRCDNLIFHPREPKVLAVIDWELSTLGHPLADFSYHLMMYRMPPMETAGLYGADLQALGIPCEEAYVAAYCRRTGREEGIPHLDFYFAYNLFRLAAIVHGIQGRVVRGTAASRHARQMGAMIAPLAELGWAHAEKAMRQA
jgi:aminoglycoside phosphotransferase (APT) family kinase protein